MKRRTAVLCGLAWAALLGGPALAQAQTQPAAAKGPFYNTVKQKLLDHKQVFSFTVNKLDVPQYCENAKHYDCAFFDMQHSTM